MTGSKKKIIDKLAKGPNKVMKMQEAEKLVPYVLDAIKEVLLEEGVVTIRGLASLKLEVKPEHDARDPRTGEKIHVPARLHPKCSFSKQLKDELKEYEVE